jgi:NAD+ diphosphatase
MDFTPGTEPAENLEGPPLFFVFESGRLLIRAGGENEDSLIPCGDELSDAGVTLGFRQFIGTLNSRPCYAASLEAGKPPPERFELKPLRALLTRLDEGQVWAAGRANQLLYWEKTHRFCSACGCRIEDKADEHAKVCPECGLINYPRVTPAVIVAVTRDERILLARNRQARVPFYSVLAGFVEPSETLEECVLREVREETGITVRNIRYFGSQPWPFPNSLMIGFTAEYAAGEIRIDTDELSDAAWFTRESLPRVPPVLSIAGQLIDWFVRSR